MKLNVFFAEPIGVKMLDEIKNRLNESINLGFDPSLISTGDCHIIVTDNPKREYFISNPNLKILIIPYTGVPEGIRLLMTEFPHVAVYNSHHTAAPTAEMAVALLFAAARQLIPADRALRGSDWFIPNSSGNRILLEGKTVLILGYGHVGRRVAKVCNALYMSVLAIRRRISSPIIEDGSVNVFPPYLLSDLLPKANVLIITLPLTTETERLIGAKELAKLPFGAILVNVGRGPIVDEQALFYALRDHHLNSAGLDVWYNYPPDDNMKILTSPSNYPFYELNNVVLSPHQGADTEETESYLIEQLAEMINAAARGEPIPNRVDLLAGY